MVRDFDSAVVVGSGPNGLAAAITMQRAGVQVLLLEARSTIGGGMRTAELTLPGFHHDVCSAIHPMAALSPFFKTLPLEKFGLEFINPRYLRPIRSMMAMLRYCSTRSMRRQDFWGLDRDTYQRFVGDLIPLWPAIADDVLGPFGIPSHPIDLARFGFKALLPATTLAKFYHSEYGKGLFAGMAAHSMQPLSKISTSAIALVLSIAGHLSGWPLPKGGSQSIANAMAQYFLSLGGVIETGEQVNHLDELPARRVVYSISDPVSS